MRQPWTLNQHADAIVGYHGGIRAALRRLRQTKSHIDSGPIGAERKIRRRELIAELERRLKAREPG
jgi:hypothetical protein